MSKSTSLKGYAVGALVALVSSLFMVAPAAQADANGPVTLLPTAGTTFNTVIGSPIELVAVQDASTMTGTARQSADSTYYVISNPALANITIKLIGDPDNGNSTFSYFTYDADGDFVASKSATHVPSHVVLADANKTITTTASKIAVSAAFADGDVLNKITLDAVVDTATVTLTVQALVDASLTKQGVADSFDRVSKAETVVLYSPGAVTATTTINTLVPTGTTFKASVVYGNNVNPHFVAANTKVSVFKQGTVVALSESSPAVVSNKVQGYVSATTTTGQTKNVITFGFSGSDYVSALTVLTGSTALSAWDASVYSAQSYYKNSAGAFVTVGAASAVANVSAGTVAVAGVSVSHTVTTDTSFSSPTLSARSGTKALTLNAQIRSASANLAAANAELKAVLTVNKLAAGSSVTITGAATALVAGGSAVTAYGRTDTDGKASFTITSNNGTKADSVNVHIFVKNTAGVWVSETSSIGNNLVWANAAFSSFAASPVDYVSGTNPTVTFKVKDQFGGALDAISSKPLSVYAVASFGGVADATKYAATANVVGGAATFTFANFAAAGGLAQLNASLLYGGTTFTVATVAQVDTVNVYNTAVTSQIAVVESFDTAVTYVDYVTGDTEVAAVAAAVAAAGLDIASDKATIAGSVLNTAGAGQPGVAVTVAADGVLFLSNDVYTLGTVTAAANEFGAFSVTAFAHSVNAKGATVTITADGLSATTLLRTYLPSTLTADNLDLSWTVPANVVKNTTYAITVTLTDKWGNAVAANKVTTNNAVSIDGNGSVEINSATAAADRNFDKNGQATVFLRSIKDIAGPGSLTATLLTTGWTFPTGVLGANTGTGTAATVILTDKKSTAWDESLWSNVLSVEVEVLDSAADIVTVADTKVNVGTFKGYVALYAKGYKGSKMSAIVAGKWIVVSTLASDFERVVRFTGAGYDITTTIYIDGVMVETFQTLTK